MRQPTNNRRRGVPAVLWSEFLALCRDHARRPALPLLLAMLLFVSAPFLTSANCSSEMGGHSHEASTSHVHGVAATTDEHHDSAEPDDHHSHDSAPQAKASHGATLQTPVTCCSCSSEPLTTTVAAVSAPKNPKADSHALIYAVVNASPVYRADVLDGLHSRAGPPIGKPQRLSLASLIGRAPPLSL